MPTPHKRVLLKLSGEALSSPPAGGIEPTTLNTIAAEIADAASTGVQIAVVIGGGNFIRGASLAKDAHIHQATADHMGMLATIINGLALKEALLHQNIDARVMTAIDVRAVAEPFIRGRALAHLDKGRVVILVAGTGNPFFTTDTCASLRATELECDILLKATKVDGVYSADPKTNPNATRYDHITFAQALADNLAVMDMTALAMCQENNIPVRVFDFAPKGNIRRATANENLGTLVTNA